MLESSFSKLKNEKRKKLKLSIFALPEIKFGSINRFMLRMFCDLTEKVQKKVELKKKSQLEARANSISNWIAHQTVAKSNLCTVYRQCWIENHLSDSIIVWKPEKRIVSMRKVFTINALIRLFSVHSFIDSSALCFFSVVVFPFSCFLLVSYNEALFVCTIYMCHLHTMPSIIEFFYNTHFAHKHTSERASETHIQILSQLWTANRLATKQASISRFDERSETLLMGAACTLTVCIDFIENGPWKR